MIEVERVHHLGIRVIDEQQAIDFYRHFGFEVERRADGDDVTILRSCNQNAALRWGNSHGIFEINCRTPNAGRVFT